LSNDCENDIHEGVLNDWCVENGVLFLLLEVSAYYPARFEAIDLVVFVTLRSYTHWLGIGVIPGGLGTISKVPFAYRSSI
jgi:hypothetical protein